MLYQNRENMYRVRVNLDVSEIIEVLDIDARARGGYAKHRTREINSSKKLFVFWATFLFVLDICC